MYGENGEFAKADSLYHLATAIAYKLKDKKLLGAVYHNSGGLAALKNNFKVAFEKYDTALIYYREVDNKRGIAGIMRNFAMDYYFQGNYSEAIRYSYLALKYYEEIKNRSKVGECYFFIGNTFKEYGNYPESLTSYFQALKIFEGLNNKPDVVFHNKHNIARTISSIAEVYLLQGNPGSAIDIYSSALQLFETYQNLDWYSSGDIPGCYIGMGRAYELYGDSIKANGDHQKAGTGFYNAEIFYNKALKMSRERKHENKVAEALFYLGKLSIRQKEYVNAENRLKEALVLSGKIRVLKLQRDSYLSLSKLYELTGNNNKAYDHYKKYILYRDSIVNEEAVRKTEGFKMQYEFDKKEEHIKLLTTENQLKTALASKQKQQKEFAIAGMAVILLAGGYGFYRYRRRKKLQSQQAVLKERLRISSELHDEVGATLSGIAMYSHLTKEQMKAGQTAEIEKSLHVMQQSSTQMVDKLSDIVWLINPEQDSLQKLITRLEEYATDMAAIKNMQVKISVPGKITEINLPVESRRNIYLFCKEAINNAVKYSNATLLELTVKEVEGILEFSVSDNGKGFGAVMVKRGNGLENMQKRADEIGAKLVLQSKENEGASVSLQCKIT
jgi:signal transduction histidine kinase